MARRGAVGGAFQFVLDPLQVAFVLEQHAQRRL
jgi:hypothetical protein